MDDYYEGSGYALSMGKILEYGTLEFHGVGHYLKTYTDIIITQEPATSPPFELNPGEEVSVAGPSSDTIYQASAAGQTTASATFHFQTENGQAVNITKPFVFTIS